MVSVKNLATSFDCKGTPIRLPKGFDLSGIPVDITTKLRLIAPTTTYQSLVTQNPEGIDLQENVLNELHLSDSRQSASGYRYTLIDARLCFPAIHNLTSSAPDAELCLYFRNQNTTGRIVCICLGLSNDGKDENAPYFVALSNTALKMRPPLTTLFDESDTFIEYVGADMRGRTSQDPNPTKMCDPVSNWVTYFVCTGVGSIGNQLGRLKSMVNSQSSALVQMTQTLPSELVTKTSLVYGIKLGPAGGESGSAVPTSALKCYRINPDVDVRDGKITLGGPSTTTLQDELVATQMNQTAALAGVDASGWQPGDVETTIAIIIAVILGIIIIIWAIQYFFPEQAAAVVSAVTGGAAGGAAAVGSLFRRRSPISSSPPANRPPAQQLPVQQGVQTPGPPGGSSTSTTSVSPPPAGSSGTPTTSTTAASSVSPPPPPGPSGTPITSTTTTTPTTAASSVSPSLPPPPPPGLNPLTPAGSSSTPTTTTTAASSVSPSLPPPPPPGLTTPPIQQASASSAASSAAASSASSAAATSSATPAPSLSKNDTDLMTFLRSYTPVDDDELLLNNSNVLRRGEVTSAIENLRQGATSGTSATRNSDAVAKARRIFQRRQQTTATTTGTAATTATATAGTAGTGATKTSEFSWFNPGTWFARKQSPTVTPPSSSSSSSSSSLSSSSSSAATANNTNTGLLSPEQLKQFANNSRAAQEEADRLFRESQQAAAASSAAVDSVGTASAGKTPNPNPRQVRQQLAKVQQEYVRNQLKQKTDRMEELTQKLREIQQKAPGGDMKKLPESQYKYVMSLLHQRKLLDEEIRKLNPPA
jgi:hypothetical protein